jgi:hypothetical protein
MPELIGTIEISIIQRKRRVDGFSKPERVGRKRGCTRLPGSVCAFREHDSGLLGC